MRFRGVRIAFAFVIVCASLFACRKHETESTPPSSPALSSSSPTPQSTPLESPSQGGLLEASDPATGIAVNPQEFIPAHARATEFAPGQLFFFSIHVKNVAPDMEFKGTVTASDGTVKFSETKKPKPELNYLTFAVDNSDHWPPGDYRWSISLGPYAEAGTGTIRIGQRAVFQAH